MLAGPRSTEQATGLDAALSELSLTRQTFALVLTFFGLALVMAVGITVYYHHARRMRTVKFQDAPEAMDVRALELFDRQADTRYTIDDGYDRGETTDDPAEPGEQPQPGIHELTRTTPVISMPEGGKWYSGHSDTSV